MSESSSEKLSEPMASAAASLRCGCFSSAMMPEATIGTAGMSHRIRVIDDAAN